MRRCPRCGQSYTDPDINFCLNDGELLSRLSEPSFSSPFEEPPRRQVDDSPPTVVLDQSRVTNPTGWNPPASPIAQYQPPQGQMFGAYPANPAPSQTLPIISLVLGLCSITAGWCCSLGLLLSPAAIVMGIVALVQNKNDPEAYGGRGLAIAGIAVGSIFLVLYVIFMLIYGLALIGGNL